MVTGDSPCICCYCWAPGRAKVLAKLKLTAAPYGRRLWSSKSVSCVRGSTENGDVWLPRSHLKSTDHLSLPKMTSNFSWYEPCVMMSQNGMHWVISISRYNTKLSRMDSHSHYISITTNSSSYLLCTKYRQGRSPCIIFKEFPSGCSSNKKPCNQILNNIQTTVSRWFCRARS